MRSLLEHLPFVIPAARASVFRMSVQIYHMPAWKIRQLSGDALFAYTNEPGYLGMGTAKYIRDKADYRLDDSITAAAPFSPASATLFDVSRLPVRKLIVCNVCDEQGVISRESFMQAFCSGFEKAGAARCESFVVPDPTSDWNYFTHRVDPAVCASWIFAGASRCRNHITGVKILTTDESNLAAYKAELAKLKEVAPSVNEFREPIQ